MYGKTTNPFTGRISGTLTFWDGFFRKHFDLISQIGERYQSIIVKHLESLPIDFVASVIQQPSLLSPSIHSIVTLGDDIIPGYGDPDDRTISYNPHKDPLDDIAITNMLGRAGYTCEDADLIVARGLYEAGLRVKIDRAYLCRGSIQIAYNILEDSKRLVRRNQTLEASIMRGMVAVGQAFFFNPKSDEELTLRLRAFDHLQRAQAAIKDTNAQYQQLLWYLGNTCGHLHQNERLEIGSATEPATRKFFAMIASKTFKELLELKVNKENLLDVDNAVLYRPGDSIYEVRKANFFLSHD